MKMTLNGWSVAVCERCMVRCQDIYCDREGRRLRLILCPLCDNGNPELDIENCGVSPEDLDGNLRMMRFVQKEIGDEETLFKQRWS